MDPLCKELWEKDLNWARRGRKFSDSQGCIVLSSEKIRAAYVGDLSFADANVA